MVPFLRSYLLPGGGGGRGRTQVEAAARPACVRGLSLISMPQIAYFHPYNSILACLK